MSTPIHETYSLLLLLDLSSRLANVHSHPLDVRELVDHLVLPDLRGWPGFQVLGSQLRVRERPLEPVSCKKESLGQN